MKRKPSRPAQPPPAPSDTDPRGPSQLRIIGGRFRGRKLLYSGRFETRPMKERVREAIFNLLGPAVAGKHAIDLFAGTGVLGLEAMSRGAVSATLIERHVPTAQVIRQNVTYLDLEETVEVTTASAFVWARREARQKQDRPWVVFCSPPYDFYVGDQENMLALVQQLLELAPAGSLFAVESDLRFDFGVLPQAESWDVRDYPPARVGILRK